MSLIILPKKFYRFQSRKQDYRCEGEQSVYTSVCTVITVTIADYFFSDIRKEIYSSKISSSILSSILVVLMV